MDDESGDAEEKKELDYTDFYSILMYYGHMSKQEIKHSSRAFLTGIYRMYSKRACENLGISPDKKKENEEDQQEEYGTLGERTDGYPTRFRKIDAVSREKTIAAFTDTHDFLSQFPMARGFKNVTVLDGTETIIEEE